MRKRGFSDQYQYPKYESYVSIAPHYTHIAPFRATRETKWFVIQVSAPRISASVSHGIRLESFLAKTHL